MPKFYSWIGNSETGPKIDRATKVGAIAELRKRGYGQVWTSDGCHLVAWIEGGRIRICEP